MKPHVFFLLSLNTNFYSTVNLSPPRKSNAEVAKPGLGCAPWAHLRPYLSPSDYTSLNAEVAKPRLGGTFRVPLRPVLISLRLHFT